MPFLIIWDSRKERARDEAGEVKTVSSNFHDLSSTPTHGIGWKPRAVFQNNSGSVYEKLDSNTVFL